jgi:hypothetical protein
MNPSTTTIPEQTAGTEASAPQALPGLLRAHAAGLLTEVAAVDLLIAHRYWLARPAFTARFVHPVTAQDGRHIGAWIDWPATITALKRGELPSSSSEADMLRIAASLAADLPINLRDVLGALDDLNIAAVTTAITNANGT